MGDTYNGWKNYPTWCVNLWLSNDEGLCHETLEIARACSPIDHAASCLPEHMVGPDAEGLYECANCGLWDRVGPDQWTAGQNRRGLLADRLKLWVSDELAPDLGASFAADLLGYALDQVDWHELADAWLENVAEEVV